MIQYIYQTKKMSVPCKLVMSELWPTDGWEHSEQPTADLPLCIDYIKFFG